MKEFLSPFLRDIIAVIGLAGVVFSVVGVWFAWWQLRKTVTASEAALAQLNQSKEKHAEYLYTCGLRLLTEARSFASNEKFEQTYLRLIDLGHVMLTLSMEDDSWNVLCDLAAEMEITFERISKDELQFRLPLKTKWRDLEQKIRFKFQEKNGLFGNISDVS